MKLKLYATGSRRLGAKETRVSIKGDFKGAELDALGKCLGFLVGEGHTSIGYDSALQVFFFRGKRNLRADVNRGFVLSLTDARAGACDTIFQPPSF